MILWSSMLSAAWAARSVCNRRTSDLSSPQAMPKFQTTGTATISAANRSPAGMRVFVEIVTVPSPFDIASPSARRGVPPGTGLTSSRG